MAGEQERAHARADERPGEGASRGPTDADREAWDSAAVRRLRGYLGDSQAGLAARLGTRQQTISEWETGVRRPRRMSRRLLRLVAEESGYYDADGPADGSPAGTGVPPSTAGETP